MRFCRNCGEELDEEDVLCPRCGSDPNSTPIRPSPREKMPFYVIAAVLILVAAVVVVPLIFNQDRSQELPAENYSYKMTFTVNWYAVVDASGTVDNGYDEDAEVYFQVNCGGNNQLILFDENYPSGDYSVTSVPVYANISSAMANKTFPSEGNTAVFYIPENETVATITIFMYDYDGPDKFSTASYDDVLDIYDADSPDGSSGSQGVVISAQVGKNKTDELGGDMDPRGFFSYTVSFEKI